MNAKTQKQFESRAKIIKALAHPTRLFIAEQLAKQENCVCNLTDMVGVDISTISKHLAILKAAGIVEDEKRGMQVCYRLKKGCVKNLLQCTDNIIKENQPRRQS